MTDLENANKTISQMLPWALWIKQLQENSPDYNYAIPPTIREIFINVLMKLKWKPSIFVHVGDLFSRLLLGGREKELVCCLT